MKDAGGFRGVALVRALLLAGAVAPLAARAAGEADAREHLAQERRSIEARHAERERQCDERFAVTACREAARAQFREALAALAAREAALDDAERRQRALDRQARIDAKVARQAASGPDREPLPLLPAEEVSRRRLGPAPRQTPPPPRAAQPTSEEVKARETASRDRYDQREREARERKRAAAARQGARALEGKSAAPPLPALEAASTPRTR